MNNICITDIPAVGTEYKIPDTADVQSLSDGSVLKYLGQNGITIGTLGIAPPTAPPPPPLTMAVILKPVMTASYMGATGPNILGYYPIALNSTIDFINVNPLASTYPGTNRLNHEDSGAMFLGTPPLVSPELAHLPMTAKHVEYQIPWPSPLGDIWVWNPYLILETVTFKDIAGNVACSAPLIVLYDHTAGIEECLIASLTVDFVSSDGYTATLRLTRSHAPTAHINLVPPYGHINMYWTPVTSALYEDPANIGNPDIRLTTLPPGLYTFGVRSDYVSDTLHYTWPAESICTQVIEIF